MKKVHKIYLISLIIIAVPFVALWCLALYELEHDPYILSSKNPGYVETLIEVDLPDIAATTSEYKDQQRWLAHNCTFEHGLSKECINQLEQLCKENDKWSKKRDFGNGETYYYYNYQFGYEYKPNTIWCKIYNNRCHWGYTTDNSLMGLGFALVMLPILAVATIAVWTILLYATAGIIYLIRKSRKNNGAIKCHSAIFDCDCH